MAWKDQEHMRTFEMGETEGVQDLTACDLGMQALARTVRTF